MTCDKVFHQILDSALMSEFKKVQNPYKLGQEISQKIVRTNKTYNEYLKEFFNGNKSKS